MQRRDTAAYQIKRRNHDSRYIDQQDQADPPKVELVAEDVVADSSDDGSLESIVGSARHTEGEDDAETDYPGWKKSE